MRLHNCHFRHLLYWLLVPLLVCLPCSMSLADSIPIDSTLFTIESSPGIATWVGNTLTLDLSQGGPLYGGYTQTLLLSSSVLPQNIVGISFTVESSLANPQILFSFNVYDSNGIGQGYVGLDNYLLTQPTWDLTTFVRQTYGPAGGSPDYNDLEFIGANYSPFPLVASNLNDLFSCPEFSLDFRATGWNGTEYLPGTVTFEDICWITSSTAVPEPATLLLCGLGLVGLMAYRKRFKKA